MARLVLALLVLTPSICFTQVDTFALEAHVFAALNEYRIQRGLDPLAADHRLGLAARRHARSMRDHDFFDHVDPTDARDRTYGVRAARAGYDWRSVGENLALFRMQEVEDVEADAVADRAIRVLHDSRLHRRLMQDREMVDAGIGVAVASDPAGSAGTVFVVQLFGRPSVNGAP